MIRATARTVSSGGFTAASAGRRGGFSLTELLIAIGVLGIGLGMIAALFVTGLAQVRMSLSDSEGGMVAANGIAVAKMFLKPGVDVDTGTASGGSANTLTTAKQWVANEFQDCHVKITGGAGIGQVRAIDSNTSTGTLTVSPAWITIPTGTSAYTIASGVPSDSLAVMADEAHKLDDNTGPISAAFQKYPYDDATTNKGFVILARRAGAGAYQVVSVAYAKSGAGTVTAQTVTGSTETTDGVTTLTVTAGGDNLKVGSTVIVAATGEYARVITPLSSNAVTLDHAVTMGSGAEAYVIVEAGAGSPATGVCITKTGLKP